MPTSCHLSASCPQAVSCPSLPHLHSSSHPLAWPGSQHWHVQVCHGIQCLPRPLSASHLSLAEGLGLMCVCVSGEGSYARWDCEGSPAQLYRMNQHHLHTQKRAEECLALGRMMVLAPRTCDPWWESCLALHRARDTSERDPHVPFKSREYLCLSRR